MSAAITLESDKSKIFSGALGIGAPWQVTQSQFDAVAQRFDIDLSSLKGARFVCPTWGAHDVTPRKVGTGGIEPSLG